MKRDVGIVCQKGHKENTNWYKCFAMHARSICIFDDSFGCCSYICKVLVSVLFFSRNAAVVPASLGFKSLTPPTTHAQFGNKAYRAETKFEKGASDRNLQPSLCVCGAVLAHCSV